VSTQFGYHLIQILEHNPAKTKTFDEVQDKVRELLAQQKKQEMVKNYLAQLKQKAKIVYRDAKDSSPQ
jgi:parvulin-like peptidyl-prolyl isomerase